MLGTTVSCSGIHSNIKPPKIDNALCVDVKGVNIVDKRDRIPDVEVASPTKEMNYRYRSAIDNTLMEYISACNKDSDNKANIIIYQSTIQVNAPQTVVFRNIPIFGLLFFGQDFEISASIRGVVEIENKTGKVLNKGDFNVIENGKGKCDTAQECIDAQDIVAIKSLEILPREINSVFNKYLYDYLK
jgi:hypothetical protein